MKSLITTILLLNAVFIYGQNSFQIADTTKIWNTVFYGNGTWGVAYCSGTWTNKLGDEFMINNSTFRYVLECRDSLQQDWDINGYLREDTLDKKVYYSWDAEVIGLLYDFGITVGDSVVIDNYYVGFEDALLICDSIDSVYINDSYRKRFFLLSPDLAPDIWIEGIGSEFGLLCSGFNASMIAGGSSDLLCCYKEDTLLYYNQIYDACYIDEFYPKIVADSYDTAYLNTYYEFHVELSGTNNVDSFALIGDVIPEGFNFDETTGVLSGIPTSTGDFTCIITVKNFDIGFLTDILYEDIPVVLPSSTGNIPGPSGIKIYPNPCSKTLCIEEEIQGSAGCIEIYNPLGLPVHRANMTGNKMQIDVSVYEPGLYLVIISDRNHRLLNLQKVVIK